MKILRCTLGVLILLATMIPLRAQTSFTPQKATLGYCYNVVKGWIPLNTLAASTGFVPNESTSLYGLNGTNPAPVLCDENGNVSAGAILGVTIPSFPSSGTGCLLYTEATNSLSWSNTCGSGGSSAWSSLTTPITTLSLSIAPADTTTFTWTTAASPSTTNWTWTGAADSGTSTTPIFRFDDTTGNTRTGPLLDIHTVGTSTALPVRITAQGVANGVSMDHTGLLEPLGSGAIYGTQVATISTTSASSFYPLFVASTSNGYQAPSLDSGLSYVPSTHTLTATTFSGALNGNASTATSAGSVTNALTMNNSGSGAASGTTFNGSAAETISYNTIGAQVAGTYVTPTTLDNGTLPASVTTLAVGGAGVPTQITVTATCIHSGCAGGSGTLAGITPTTGMQVEVADGTGVSDCSVGSGATLHWCYYNGSSWIAANPLGTVTSVDGSASEGAETVVSGSVAAITASGTLRGTFPYLSESGGITATEAMRGHIIVTNDASDDVYALPTPSGANFLNGWYLEIKNVSATNKLTLTPAGSTTIDGAATLVVPSHTAVKIESDGTNYHSTMISPVSLNNQGLVYASPAAASGPPNMRALVATDIPSLSQSTTVNGQSCALSGSCTVNPPLDKSTNGLANPTADATFTYPATSTSGLTLAGTAPASVSTATGTNATSLFNVNGVTGGASSNASGTGGVGSSPSISAGTGGSGTGTTVNGGAGGTTTVSGGTGGAGAGSNANGGNGGNVVLTPGSGGAKTGIGTAGSNGSLVITGLASGIPRSTSGTISSAELSGDVTTSGSNAATVVQIEGGAIPVSANLVGTNGSKQLISEYTSVGVVTWNGSGSCTYNAASASSADGTLTTVSGQTCTLVATNLVSGGYYTLVITNASSTAATLTLGTSGSTCTAWKTAPSGSGAITLTGSSGIQVFAFHMVGTVCYGNIGQYS